MSKPTAQLAQEKAILLQQPGWEGAIRAQGGGGKDRRFGSRVRPMEVLCLGLERTGTSSLRVALSQLGYFDIYHMTVPTVENPSDADIWCDAFDAKAAGKDYGKENWDRLLGDFMAVLDNPCCSFGPELIRTYPSTKVVLNVRDSPEAWHKSVMQTTYPICRLIVDPPDTANSMWRAPLRALDWLFAPQLPFAPMFRRMVTANRYWEVPEHGKEIYEEHNARIRQVAKEVGSEFLEYNVKEGWGPLCEFLGKPVPDTPFPRVNDTAEFVEKWKKLRRIVRVLYAVNVAKVVGPLVVMGLVWRYRGPLALGRRVKELFVL